MIREFIYEPRRLLHALGFQLRQCHVNEGHSALLGAELLRRHAYAPDRAGWLRVMKGAISRNASCFNSQRMMRRYATEAYLR